MWWVSCVEGGISIDVPDAHNPPNIENVEDVGPPRRGVAVALERSTWCARRSMSTLSGIAECVRSVGIERVIGLGDVAAETELRNAADAIIKNSLAPRSIVLIGGQKFSGLLALAEALEVRCSALALPALLFGR